MQVLTTRPWITAGVALAGAGVIAVTPVAAPLPGVQAADIQLTAGEVDMVLDLVRHGQSSDNVAHIIGTVPPGAPLTDLGREQAVDVGQLLYNGGNNDIDGVWASGFLRAQQTAWPLDQLMNGASSVAPDGIPDGPTPLLDPSQILPGLNELNAGFLDGVQQTSQADGLLYLVAPIAWMFGQYWVPQLGSDIDPNGMAFEDRFSDAVQTIYNAGGTLDDGELHDVAFSHAAAIATWTMMNVKNPDFGLFFDMLQKGILSNTGQVIVEGNPTDGWTLVSWDGVDADQDPGLGTELFVDFRDLITVPQMAGYHIQEAIEQAFTTGDWSAVGPVVQDGFTDVAGAFMQFPTAVWDDIIGALGDSAPGLSAELGTDAVAALL